MGIPKFYRWLSERYPRINQRQAFLPSEELCQEYYGESPPPPLEEPDPLSRCQLAPEIDRLYIDMNGVIHGCSHNNGDSTGVTEQDIFTNVCYYLERVIGEMAKPKELVYLAIDGVAPRAKLNQQRSRRYRGGSDEVELSIYDDSVKAHDEGRLSGKFEQTEEDAPKEGDEEAFHSNVITPGTEFFEKLVTHVQHFVHRKMSDDWKHLTVILSGPNTPGEGEHKIMEFMRSERSKPGYNPKLRHCIMGQDADLILLSLVTHEPYICLLRERVIFQMEKREFYRDHGLDVYLHNAHFEWLHLGILRDYLMYEFETAPAVPSSRYDLERTIDDFVFLTFFVGNDFLPHMPALDIGDEAFDLLFHVYKKQRKRWHKKSKSGKDPYLTKSGTIVCGHRLENFCRHLGSHEGAYYDNKRINQESHLQKIRKQDSRMGIESTLPSDDVLQRKEEEDRAKYREMLESLDPLQVSKTFRPVLTNDALPKFHEEEEDEELEKGFFNKMGSILNISITDENESSETNNKLSYESIDDQDLKGRYYYDKFRFTPFDADKHQELRKHYVEGLVWTLQYYYKGCVSWEWFYPHHYGPMLSDLVNVESLLNQISFEKGEPLKPFQQLLGCLPPSSSNLLPEPFRWLMNSADSPIIDFFPQSFMVDMNGKRWPWEAVVVLPFIDSHRLIQASTDLVPSSKLTEQEQKRNEFKPTLVFTHDSSSTRPLEHLGESPPVFHAMENCQSKAVPINDTHWDPTDRTDNLVFEPKEDQSNMTSIPGFPSLTSAPIQALSRKRIGTNVFGMRSRYRTAVLDTSDEILPEFPPIDVLAPKFIGTLVYINYPYLLEAFVTAVSDQTKEIRGLEQKTKIWNGNESEVWKHTMSATSRGLERGQSLPGTGGWKLPDSELMLSVRPFQSITSIDGQMAKLYAKFEIQVPFLAATWSPPESDPRLHLPAALEKDPFFVPKKMMKKNTKKKPLLLPLQYKNAPSFTETPLSGEDTHPLKIASSLSGSTPLSGLGTVASSTNSVLPPIHDASGTTRSFSSSSRSYSTFASSRRLLGQQRRPMRWTVPRGGAVTLALGAAAAFLSTAHGAVPFRQIQHKPNSFPQDHSVKSWLLSPFVDSLDFRGGDLAEESPGSTDSKLPPPLQFAHGTTTLSFLFQGGIVAAVDSRASQGNYVGSKTVQKVLSINSHCLGTMAGGAADCSYWIRKIKAQALLHEMDEGYRMSVSRASRLLSNVLFQNRGAQLSVGTMVMGYDEGGPRIFYVDNTGVRLEGDMFSVGSGSTFALGILDQERRFDMTEDEAVSLGIKAIRHATFRDAFSGGFINVYLITRDGWRKVFSEDLARSHQASNEK